MKNHKQKIENIKLLQKIFSLCTQIQNAGIGTVFFNYAGHVNWIEILIFVPIWTDKAEPTYEKIWVNTSKSSLLEQIIKDLKKILEGNNNERKL